MGHEHRYIEGLHERFKAASSDRNLFEAICRAPVSARDSIRSDISRLIESTNAAYALCAFYRQQVNSGFVLGDPISPEAQDRRHFFDSESGVTFVAHWNPDRELRKNHALLVERGVIAEHVDPAELINPDPDGRPCYLCSHNIARQNPGEILYDVELAGETFHVGANFAYITNNHFTVIAAQHRPQNYHRRVLTALLDFLEMTGGGFRAIFNARAGASIAWHEHLQATTEPFPVEAVAVRSTDIRYQSPELRVSNPAYPIPLWLIESKDRSRAETSADRLISLWHELDEHHTENIVTCCCEGVYRVFVFLRDVRKQAAEQAEKKGAIASFEAAGYMVLSLQSDDPAEPNERATFEQASADRIKDLLRHVAPDPEASEHLAGLAANTIPLD